MLTVEKDQEKDESQDQKLSPEERQKKLEAAGLPPRQPKAQELKKVEHETKKKTKKVLKEGTISETNEEAETDTDKKIQRLLEEYEFSRVSLQEAKDILSAAEINSILSKKKRKNLEDSNANKTVGLNIGYLANVLSDQENAELEANLKIFTAHDSVVSKIKTLETEKADQEAQQKTAARHQRYQELREQGQEVEGSSLLSVPEDTHPLLAMLMEYAVLRDYDRDWQLKVDTRKVSIHEKENCQWLFDETVAERGNFPVLNLSLLALNYHLNKYLKNIKKVTISQISNPKSEREYPNHAYCFTRDGSLIRLDLDEAGNVQEIVLPEEPESDRITLPPEEETDDQEAKEEEVALDENPRQWLKNKFKELYDLDLSESSQGNLFVEVNGNNWVRIIPESLPNAPLRQYLVSYWKALPSIASAYNVLTAGDLRNDIPKNKSLNFSTPGATWFQYGLLSLDVLEDKHSKNRPDDQSKEEFHELFIQKGPTLEDGESSLFDKTKELLSAKTLRNLLEAVTTVATKDTPSEDEFNWLGFDLKLSYEEILKYITVDQLNNPEFLRTLQETREALLKSKAIHEGKRLIDKFDPYIIFSKVVAKRRPILKELNNQALDIYRECRVASIESAAKLLDELIKDKKTVALDDALEILSNLDDPAITKKIFETCQTADEKNELMEKASSHPGLSRSAILYLIDNSQHYTVWKNLVGQVNFPFDSKHMATQLIGAASSFPNDFIADLITHPKFPPLERNEKFVELVRQIKPGVYVTETGEMHDLSTVIDAFYYEVKELREDITEERLRDIAMKAPRVALTLSNIPDNFSRDAMVGPLARSFKLLSKYAQKLDLKDLSDEFESQAENMKSLLDRDLEENNDLDSSLIID